MQVLRRQGVDELYVKVYDWRCVHIETACMATIKIHKVNEKFQWDTISTKLFTALEVHT